MCRISIKNELMHVIGQLPQAFAWVFSKFLEFTLTAQNLSNCKSVYNDNVTFPLLT